MLKLREVGVFGSVKSHLEGKQNEIDQEASYADRVAIAKRLWDQKSDAIFQQVRHVLNSLCVGGRRCHYCEDSAADEVEHVWPKKFYPDKAFTWENYLFACGPCNGSHKSDQFAVFDNAGQVVELVRGKNDPVVSPVNGNPVFLDPHVDNPLDYMELDLSTGIFVPIGNPTDQNYIRAEYTIRILGLNKRDYLTKARRVAYNNYIDAVTLYVDRKAANAPGDELKRRLRDLQDNNHPSVWEEVKRLARSGVGYQNMFADAPELWSI